MQGDIWSTESMHLAGVYVDRLYLFCSGYLFARGVYLAGEY